MIILHLKIIILTAVKKRSILHGRVFVMQIGFVSAEEAYKQVEDRF